LNESALDQPEEGASAALERYRTQLKSIDNEQEALRIKDRQFSKVRAILFLVSLAFLIVGYGFDGLPYVGWFGWVAMVLFLVAVTANEPVREKLDELGRHRSVVRRLVARLERDWDRLSTKAFAKQLAEVELPGHRRDVASDLDLLGHASLFHLVSMAATTPGIRTLANWLAGPAEETDAKQRWIAVSELAPMREERLRFYTLARQVADSSGDPENFIQWATGPAWLAKRSWLIKWSNLSTGLAGIMLLLTVVSGFGLLTAHVFIGSLIALGCLIAINMGLTTLMLGPAHAIFAIAMANRRAVSDYEEIFSSAQWLPDTDKGLPDTDKGLPDTDKDSLYPFLTQIRDRMLANDRSAQAGMRALQKVATAGGLRQSAGTFLIYLPLQGLMLWDVRVLKRLEDWQAEYATDVPGWFEALGELESLISVAAVRDEYPSWSQPDWVSASDAPAITATGIGHPLLADDARVCNDVQVGPPGTILLVTGSNMSGKSTMLRSVGLNVALAAVGAPVCAEKFCLPSTELATSIRVSDNVAEGVSFYMAELKRLKSVVDHAREMSRTEDRVCLFLLDEILQGTNSRERQIAVVQVLRHLMDYQSIGAISTHDLELADEPELQSVGHAVHFRETIRPDASGNEQMTFDYKMREGVSPTTNALRLLEMVGLGETADQNNKPG
jgi:ABC-type multidrug transport system fused ATPase/permease subunit